MPKTYIQERTVSVRRWRISVKVREPWNIDDEELLDRSDFNEVFQRAMTSAARASYMVGAPNREVYWKIELWDKGRWTEICDGKSKVKDRAIPNRSPLSGGIHPTSLG